jgi:hypothetical protein
VIAFGIRHVASRHDVMTFTQCRVSRWQAPSRALGGRVSSSSSPRSGSTLNLVVQPDSHVHVIGTEIALRGFE